MMNLKYYISGRNPQIKGIIKKTKLIVSLYIFLETLSKHLSVTVLIIK